MRHICAWCGCETAPPDGGADDNIISHGMCEKCKKIVLEEAGIYEKPERKPIFTAVKDIAIILGISRRAVRKKAEKEKWPHHAGINNVKLFLISVLPEDIKIAISSYQQARDNYGAQALIPTLHPSSYSPALPVPGSRNLSSGASLDKGLSKADLVRLYIQTLKKIGHGRKVHARKEFMRAYNSGIAYPQIFSLVGKISWKTIEGWKRKLIYPM